MKPKNRAILIVMDGWGIAPAGKGNCITQASTPNYDCFVSEFPNSQNKASGEAVGLPPGSQGNSEVGHLHMGAGRIVWQPFQRINNAIKDKSFFKNPALLKAISRAKKSNSKLHLMGLCSDEGVHAHVLHLFALLEMAKKEGLGKEQVLIHFFADGRDVPEKSAAKYVKQIEGKCKELGVGKIASMAGRYYAMDRDNNWKRTKKAYDMLTLGKGFKAASALEAVEQAYKRGDKTDYYIQPAVVEGSFSPIEDNDSVIFFNFRTDRPRQLTKAFVSEKFARFRREKHPKVSFATFTQYDRAIGTATAFKEVRAGHNLGETISKAGLRQLRLAETEKYAHVTYFFNSQREAPYPREDRKMIPSPKLPSYDLKPEMSAYEIAEEAVKRISSRKYDFILINFANCDLVGHSAVIPAIVKCVKVVDECTGKVVKAALENGYTAVITADHGRAEEKLYKDGKPNPAHSRNPVPFIIVSEDEKPRKAKLCNGGQKDVAPTILEIMGLKKPGEMTGKSLLKH